MSNTVKGFQTLQGVVQYDYESLKNKPDIDGKIQTALEEYKVDVDTTLKNAGEAADAKATGEKIAQAISDANAYTDEQLGSFKVNVDTTLEKEGEAADAKATGDAIDLINDQMAEMPFFADEEESSSVDKVNADTLGGEPAENYVLQSEIEAFEQTLDERLQNDFLDRQYIEENYATVDSIIYANEAGGSLVSEIINADTLGGRSPNEYALADDVSNTTAELQTQIDGKAPAGNYATQSFVTNKIAEAQLGGGSGEIDLTGFATKDDIAAIDFPVDSINGKTGTVQLSAIDVGARPDTWIPSATEVGAVSAGFGFGENTPLSAPYGDPSNVSKGAIFTASQNCAHAGVWSGLNIQIADGSKIQFLYDRTNNKGVVALRMLDVNGNGEWEYLNPPMKPGAVYRTTERINNKVVYKRINYDTNRLEYSIDDGVWLEYPGLMGAAPAGYGLGLEDSPEITDANHAVKNGWYKCAQYVANAPAGYNYGWIFVESYDARFKKQTYNHDIKTVTAVRFMTNGTWDEWEWVNPPMANGVEYRTTERWNGKAVYTRMDAVGALPSNSHKTWIHGIAMTAIVRYSGVTTTGRAIPYNFVNIGEEIGIKCDTTEVCISSNFDATVYGNYFLQLWYTKD